MATIIQSRRGTTAEHAVFTGAVGEITVDTTKDTAVVHDNFTAGGHPLAKEAGNSSNAFSVGAGTSAAHAARIDQVSLLPTVASATAPDIFGAAGVTINYTGTTTATSFVACSAAQVGSKKTIVPETGASFTASANLIVDDATSGTYLMPANAIVEVIPLTTTKFKVMTVYASGDWTPNQGAGLTVVGAFSSAGKFIKTGRSVTVTGYVIGATSVACAASGTISSNLPFSGITGHYQALNALKGSDNSTYGGYVSGTSAVLGAVAITANARIDFTASYIQ